MCGRITRASSRQDIAEEFGVTHFVNVDLTPRYNIAPSQSVEAIVRADNELRLGPMRWGLAAVPPKEAKAMPINARAETIATAPAFRDAFRRRRCWIVADGFYEWQTNGNAKTPYFIHLRSGRPFALAGIWSSYQADGSTRVPTCAIVTCAPNELMAPIHNRMPVILSAGVRDRWLDPAAEARDLRALLAPLAAEEMEAYPVSTVVNSPRNDSAECMRRVD